MIQIPLSTGAQVFTVTLGDYSYKLTLIYRDAEYGSWALDIERQDGSAAIHGIPVVCGIDLLGQYQYRGFGHLYAFVGERYDKTPDYEDMGNTLNLYWEAA